MRLSYKTLQILKISLDNKYIYFITEKYATGSEFIK